MMKEYKINTEIYDENIVKQAIEDFKEVSEITYKNNIISINDENSDVIFDELMNYTIWLINE